MNDNGLAIGNVVLSTKGRDKGTYFAVVGVDAKNGYVYLADGGARKLNAPKKKKHKARFLQRNDAGRHSA